MKAETVRFKS